MTNEIKIDDLEKALLDRANALSKEYFDRAKRSYAHFIEDENERLRLREEREVMSAKMQSEQLYRRMVQTQELLTIKRIDQLRWQLMNKVLEDVRSRLQQLVTDKDNYTKLIIEMLKQVIDLIPSQQLLIEFNPTDHKLFINQWDTVLSALNSTKTIKLADKFCHSIGGFIIYNESQTIRINNTFEGLIELHSEEIHQIIAENLFAELTPVRSNIHER